MRRIAFAIAIVTITACSHTSSATSGQDPQPVVRDSNFVTYDELQADARQGHVFLYDALKSTRPEMLKSAGDRGWPWVYLLDPSQQLAGPSALNPLSPITDIQWLQKIPTAQVKWVRRYRSVSAPLMYKSISDWSLVVALR